jgi:hypothetical protein
MNLKKLLVAALAVGLAMNVVDFVVHGNLFENVYYSQIPIFRRDNVVPFLVLGDFIAAFVFVWVYDRVRGAFDAGAAGGATYGLYAGVLMNFPANIFTHLLIKDFPYALSWAWTIYGVVLSVILGAVAGAIYRK